MARTMLEVLKQGPVSGDLGIEIEVEGRRLPDEMIEATQWVAKDDGSLRNGMEYVFGAPLVLKDVREALEALNREFKISGSRLEFSFRTSVHAHVNIQRLTYNQLLNFIYTYLLLEGPLMDFCGESRKGNRFCLRLQDAEYLIDILSMLFSEGEKGIQYIPRDNVRYAAINIEAIGKFGSVEFRALSGTTDTEKIMQWCTTLIEIRDFATKYKTPMEIYSKFMKEGPDAFLKEVIRTYPEVFITEHSVQQVKQNFSLSIDLPFAFKNKEKEEVKNPFEPVRRKKRPPVVVLDDALEDIRRGFLNNEFINRAEFPDVLEPI